MSLPDPTDEDFAVLTVPEVAAILRIGRTTVYELVKRGELRSLPHTGRKTLIAKRAVREFIAR